MKNRNKQRLAAINDTLSLVSFWREAGFHVTWRVYWSGSIWQRTIIVE